jgi:antitoxin component of MazEF toxin-antitoxin module
MKALVQRHDGKLVVIIPDDLAEQELIEENVEVEIRRPYVVPADYLTLDEMLDRITPETLHDPIDWGPDVGNEIVKW